MRFFLRGVKRFKNGPEPKPEISKQVEPDFSDLNRNRTNFSGTVLVN